ncbi:L-gulonolactone oxidase-like [Protopterus annectens]|uniref:L-gulonolactone oxidase-like n=1 Tax=Protopterus annectens TaxID=7888 RepID=UPI001CFB4D46|nr:L-gulonolactone oxidase-like [Protopterus annectens]
MNFGEAIILLGQVKQQEKLLCRFPEAVTSLDCIDHNACAVQGREGYRFQNWATTFGSYPELYFEPTSVEEIREILDLARQRSKKVKVIGGGHSPSDIACTDGYMIQLNKMNRILKIDKEKRQVTFEAGLLLTQLNEELFRHGLALTNLGAVSDVTAAGIIGTGTHNTGIQHGILGTQVVALTFMTASGEIMECADTVNKELFQAARLHLGSLGVILTVTLQCETAFRLHEQIFPSTLKEVLDNLDSHLKKSEYFRFLWFPHTENASVIYQDRTDKPISDTSNWFWDYAVGYYLLEFLLWISMYQKTKTDNRQPTMPASQLKIQVMIQVTKHRLHNYNQLKLQNGVCLGINVISIRERQFIILV